MQLVGEAHDTASRTLSSLAGLMLGLGTMDQFRACVLAGANAVADTTAMARAPMGRRLPWIAVRWARREKAPGIAARRAMCSRRVKLIPRTDVSCRLRGTPRASLAASFIRTDSPVIRATNRHSGTFAGPASRPAAGQPP